MCPVRCPGLSAARLRITNVWAVSQAARIVAAELFEQAGNCYSQKLSGGIQKPGSGSLVAFLAGRQFSQWGDPLRTIGFNVLVKVAEGEASLDDGMPGLFSEFPDDHLLQKYFQFLHVLIRRGHHLPTVTIRRGRRPPPYRIDGIFRVRASWAEPAAGSRGRRCGRGRRRWISASGRWLSGETRPCAGR